MTYAPQQHNSQTLGQIVHHVQPQNQHFHQQQQQSIQHIRQHSQPDLTVGMNSSNGNSQIVGHQNNNQTINHSIQQTISNQHFQLNQQKTKTHVQNKQVVSYFKKIIHI